MVGNRVGPLVEERHDSFALSKTRLLSGAMQAILDPAASSRASSSSSVGAVVVHFHRLAGDIAPLLLRGSAIDEVLNHEEEAIRVVRGNGSLRLIRKMSWFKVHHHTTSGLRNERLGGHQRPRQITPKSVSPLSHRCRGSLRQVRIRVMSREKSHTAASQAVTSTTRSAVSITARANGFPLVSRMMAQAIGIADNTKSSASTRPNHATGFSCLIQRFTVVDQLDKRNPV